MKINIYLVLILALAAVLRFYQLGQIPPSLNWDEVSNGYNAYSILKTAQDEHGNFLPLTFRAFGDYNPALSVYTLVPSIAIFGLNEFAVRFPSALLGTLTVLLTYLLTKKLFEDDSSLITHSPREALSEVEGAKRGHSSLKNVALLAAFFMAISPWHLQFSRYDHEANFMVFFSVLALTLLLYSFKNPKLLIFSALSFGLALNTYHGAKIWIPLFILAIVVFFLKPILSFKSKLIIPLVILILSTYPIFSNFEKTTIRSSSVGIFANNPNPTNTFREGYLSHFSLNFLFTAGDRIPRHSVFGMGQLYVFELPLLLLGIVFLVKSTSPMSRFLLVWLLLAPIPASLAAPTPHALRSITFLPVLQVITSLGLAKIFTAKISQNLKIRVVIILSAIAVYNFATYLHLYYKHYPKLASIDWQDGSKEMINFISPIKDKYATVAITNYYGHPYIFLLFYTKFDPRTYQNLEDKSKFDKFEFFGESWEKKTPGLALVIRPEWQKPDPPPKYIKEIRDTSGQVIFRISEEE